MGKNPGEKVMKNQGTRDEDAQQGKGPCEHWASPNSKLERCVVQFTFMQALPGGINDRKK